MKRIKSRIHLEEKVLNQDRRFGAATHYYPVEIRFGSNVQRGFMTPAGLTEATARYDANKEDWPPSLWERIKAWFRA